ncbi:MAG: phospholipid carrier-dependent glycosyltransferase [Patescibacteria group bacterium]
MNIILWILCSMAGGIVFFLFSLLLGSKMLSILKVNAPDEEWFLFSAGLGVGISAGLLLVLGFMGAYTKEIILLTAVAISILCISEVKKIIISAQSIKNTAKKNENFLNKIMRSVLILFALLFVLVAASPETEWDAISFHLATAKVYIEHQQIVPIYYAYHAALPHLFDMLYVVGELWNSDVLSRMFVLLCNLTIVLGIWILGKKLFSERAGLIGACIFLTTPILMVYMPSTYIDIPLGLFAVCAILAIWNWKQATQKERWIWVWITALMCTFMVSSKIVTLPFVAGCMLYFLWHIWKTKKMQEATKGITIFALCLVIILGPWMIFNYIHLNNPIYPFADTIFHGKYWSPELAQWWSDARNTYSGGKNITDFILKPFILTYIPNINGPIYGFSPIYLMFIPLLVFWAGEKRKELTCIGSIAFISWLGWCILAPDMRYIFYLIPILALSAGYAIDSLFIDTNIKEYTKKIVYLVMALIVLSNLLFFFVIFRNDVQMWTGKITREEFITIDTPNYFVAQWANKNLPQEAFIFLANDDKGYYFDREYTLGYGIFSTYIDYAHLSDGDALYQRLKEIGITHVLFKEYETGLIGYDKYYNEHTTQLFEELKEEHLTEIYEKNSVYLYELS